MRIAFLLIGFLFLPQNALALDAPAMPLANSPYVLEVFDLITTNLTGAPAGTPASCAQFQKTVARKESAERLRALFQDRIALSVEPTVDLSRTGCFVFDIQAMEHVLSDLIKKTMEKAGECNGDAEERYFDQAAYLWKEIQNVRRGGLNPRLRTGEGPEVPPLTATSASDDAICPYDSDYAPVSLAQLGCQEILLSTFMTLGPFPSVSQDELSLGESILLHLQGSGGGGLSGALPLYRGSLSKIWQNAAAFVAGVTTARFPGPLKLFEPILTPFIAGNVGESGCYGWPANAGGVVTGEGITHQNAFPDILTRDLTDAFQFLKAREEPMWIEYIHSLRQEPGSPDGEPTDEVLSLDDLQEINREHILRESQLILGLRDPQARMANLANDLHQHTRAFTSQAVGLTGTPSGMPPLRDFAKRFSEFLMGMCTNRGCLHTLVRSVELSLRDECFPHFRSALFFAANPTAATLQPCRAKYAEW